MQQQKAFGDVKASSPSRNFHHRRSVPKKSGGNGNSYLATDVTTLDINTMFQSKKFKKNAPPTGNSVFPFSQHSGYPLSAYQNSNFLYQNLDLANAAGDLPPLMSVPSFKPSTFPHGYGDMPAMDFAQFSEQLKAIQSDTYQSAVNPLHSLLALNEVPVSAAQYFPLKSTSTLGNRGARKNRMVEVKTINDQSVVVVSDPQAASASARSTVVPLNRHIGGVPKSLETPKKQISAEPLYSRKVFIGGLPIDVTEEEVWTTFGAFGKVLVDWPRRPEHGSRSDSLYEVDVGRRNSRSVSGYVFLVFTEEQSVQALVNACELFEDKYYLQLSSPTMSDKAVQVRAWRLSDIDYFSKENASVDHRRTVFIGGVPRPTRAKDLARCLQEHYGKVSYVGIDIDPELKYPKGAARVTFATAQSFVRAISGRFVQVTHADTNKRVEIKPYVMEDQYCDECQGALCQHSYAQYFCGDASCLQYYCAACWDRMHYEMSKKRENHRPMVRTGDQTKVLQRPSHHQSSVQYRYQQQHHHHSVHQLHNQPSSPVDYQHAPFISRVLNRNSSSNNNNTSSKPFAAVPTTIGF